MKKFHFKVNGIGRAVIGSGFQTAMMRLAIELQKETGAKWWRTNEFNKIGDRKQPMVIEFEGVSKPRKEIQPNEYGRTCEYWV